MNEKTDYLKMDELKNGFTYLMTARNGFIGVWNAESRGFVFVREKFGREYLFTEFHWDTGPPFGTVHPIQEVEECPIEDLRESWKDEENDCWIENRPLFDYLKSVEEKGLELQKQWRERIKREDEERRQTAADDLGLSLEDYTELIQTISRWSLTKLRWLPYAEECIAEGSFVDVSEKRIKNYKADLLRDECRIEELTALVSEDKRAKVEEMLKAAEERNKP